MLSRSLYLVGKLEHKQEDAFSLPASSTGSSLIYLNYGLSNCRFLVDTGASISVFPSPTSPSSSGVWLLTADGSTLTCSGSRIIPLCFGTWNCSWTFQLAPVSVPILGADFLQHHDLSVNVRSKKVFSNSSSMGSRVDLSSSPPSSTSPMQAAFLSTPQCVSDLLEEFPAVLQSDGFTASPPRHKVHHHILTNPGPPVFCQSLPIRSCQTCYSHGRILWHGKSWYCSPFCFSLGLSVTHGQEEGWRRPCGYHILNTSTVPDCYPLPNIANFSSLVSGSTIFSKLDLQKGYYQVLVKQEDIQKTSIITLFGMFKFLVMAFGLRNAGNTFQRLIDQIFLTVLFTLTISWFLARICPLMFSLSGTFFSFVRSMVSLLVYLLLWRRLSSWDIASLPLAVLPYWSTFHSQQINPASRRFQQDLFGQECPEMSVFGQNHVFPAKNPRSQLMFIPQFPLFQCQPGDFLTFMSIFWVLSL